MRCNSEQQVTKTLRIRNIASGINYKYVSKAADNLNKLLMKSSHMRRKNKTRC